MHSCSKSEGSNCYRAILYFHYFKANILLYYIVSTPQFLNSQLMPHLVVMGHMSFVTCCISHTNRTHVSLWHVVALVGEF